MAQQLPSPSAGWVWPLGQDPNQWQTMASMIQEGQRGQDPGLPNTQQGGTQRIPGLPNSQGGGMDTGQILSLLKGAGGTLNMGGQLANALGYQGGTLQGLGTGLGTAAGVGSGIYNLTQGNYGPGALQLAQSGYNIGSQATGGSLLNALVGAGGSELLGAYGGFGAGYDLAKLGFNLGGMKGGPTTGNPYGDIGFSLLGPFGDVGKEILGELMGPSSAWRNFGQNLQGQLMGSRTNLQDLGQELQYARNRGDLSQLVNLYNTEMQGLHGLSGYQAAQGGVPQITTPPGATGKRHEGGLTANFDPYTQQLNTLLAQAYSQLPEGQASPLSAEAFRLGWSQPMYNQYASLLGALQGQLGGSTATYTPGGYVANLPEGVQSQIAQAPDYLRSRLTQQLQDIAYQNLFPAEGVNINPSD